MKQIKWRDRILFLYVESEKRISSIEYGVFGTIKEKIEEIKRNEFTMDQIFENFTLTKRGRFNVLSSLKKKKIIRVSPISYKLYSFDLLIDYDGELDVLEYEAT